MKSSKWILGLMAIVLVMAFSSSSFAQISIQLFNTPSAGEINTNHLAQTADPTSVGAGILVSGSIIASSTLTTTYLTLQFPAPITSLTSTFDGLYGAPLAPALILSPANDPITITGATGLFASITAIYTVDVKNGQVIITLPGTVGLGLTGNSNTQSGSFRLTGVRIDAVGKTAPLSVSASLSSSANNYINASAPQTIISSLGPGATFTQSAGAGAPNNGASLLFTNQTTALCSQVIGAPFFAAGCPTDTTATFSLTEGFASAWRTAVQSSVSGTALANGTNILLTIAGLPSGISAALSQDITGAATTILADYNGGSGIFGPGTAAQTVTIRPLNTSLTTLESLQFDITLTGTPVGALTGGTITLAATMTPTAASALGSNGRPNENGPTFVSTTLGPLTITNIVSANTTMLVPYVVKTGPYDTGIAIANTTMDPFGAGGGGATPQAGNLTFTLYPRTATGAGTALSVTTSSTKIFGAGLATDGTVVAGGTWTGLLSDILTAAGSTADFFGYIFIQANFLDAHGAGYIFNGAGFTSGTPVLVLGPPAGFPRTGNVEALNN